MARRVLVFRIGSIGDTIVSLPAIWAAKAYFPGASFSLLCDRHVGSRIVMASALLEGSGLFDHYLSYPIDPNVSRIGRLFGMARLARQLRRESFDALIYLAPIRRTKQQVDRDYRFFRMSGIEKIYGAIPEQPQPPADPSVPLPMLPTEADLLLARLRADGIPTPPTGEGDMNLGLNDRDQAEFHVWADKQTGDNGRPWIGVGPGSKMPAKIWPEDRYIQVIRQLIERHDVWPVIFGGGEDIEVGRRIVAALGRGYIAAGSLGLRSAAVGLSRCKLYLGNDTGTMHLAAAVCTRCVAIFSARTNPGTWNPYGHGHQVLRRYVACEGCELMDCIVEGKRCLMEIGTGHVLSVCESILAQPAATMTLQ